MTTRLYFPFNPLEFGEFLVAVPDLRLLGFQLTIAIPDSSPDGGNILVFFHACCLGFVVDNSWEGSPPRAPLSQAPGELVLLPSTLKICFCRNNLNILVSQLFPYLSLSFLPSLAGIFN
jgi:hypothetical protein